MKAKPPISPRRRRLRVTLVLLSSLALLGVGLGTITHRKTRPLQYRPDEHSSDITSELARHLPPGAPLPRFTDVTRAAGLERFRNFAGPRSSEMPEDIGPGLAWGDFDNDGDEDLFLVSVGGTMTLAEDQLEPCALFENRGDGTFVRAESFPETRIRGNGAAWGDYDGDGFLDLAVGGFNALLLFHNEPAEGGGRKFTRDGRFPNPRGFWTGVSWGDYDNDRAPDLYVCGYIDYVVTAEDRDKSSMQIGAKVPFTLNPASFQAGTNLLFHNNRDGTFTDVAPALSVANPEGRSLGALWHDFDSDGWLDLYVANDISDNVFYRNTGGTFEDISHPALVADYRSAMGLAVGDYDRDGDDDLFVSHWVAQENALYDSTWADSQGTANPGRLRFIDTADMRGLGQIALPLVGWGAEFVDLDADGWLDLIVVNGNTLEEDTPPPKKLKGQETFLFWNRHGDYFHNLAPLHSELSAKRNSRGLAVADFDNDGAMDLAIADLGAGVRLLRNDMQSGHWLKIRLRSRNHRGEPFGFADGSTVIAHIHGASLRRCVSGVSYLSQNSRTLHLGLGGAAQVQRLEVRWHAGATNWFDNLDANATYEIVEGEGPPRMIKRAIASSAGLASSPAATRLPETDRPPAALSAASQTAPRSSVGKGRLVEFWNKQRAAMDAMKVEKNNGKAIGLFGEALALDPAHEDSLYYLGACLASTGETEAALARLAELQRVNPRSQRAFALWGSLRAQSATSAADLEAAEQSLLRAQAINPEETGVLLLLGEVALLRGQSEPAKERLADACHTNPKAAGGFFLQGYLAWKSGDPAAAKAFLQTARAALGPDWQPAGSTSEGDVKQKQHTDRTPLTRFWQAWDGQSDPDRAFGALDAFLNIERAGHATHKEIADRL